MQGGGARGPTGSRLRPVVLSTACAQRMAQRRAGGFFPIPDPPIDMSGGPGEPVVA